MKGWQGKLRYLIRRNYINKLILMVILWISLKEKSFLPRYAQLSLPDLHAIQGVAQLYQCSCH